MKNANSNNNKNNNNDNDKNNTSVHSHNSSVSSVGSNVIASPLDTSLLGARLSPIPATPDDGDDDDNISTCSSDYTNKYLERYRRVLPQHVFVTNPFSSNPDDGPNKNNNTKSTTTTAAAATTTMSAAATTTTTVGGYYYDYSSYGGGGDYQYDWDMQQQSMKEYSMLLGEEPPPHTIRRRRQRGGGMLNRVGTFWSSLWNNRTSSNNNRNHNINRNHNNHNNMMIIDGSTKKKDATTPFFLFGRGRTRARNNNNGSPYYHYYAQQHRQRQQRQYSWPVVLFGTLLSLHFFAMVVHDLYLLYLSHRLGKTTTTTNNSDDDGSGDIAVVLSPVLWLSKAGLAWNPLVGPRAVTLSRLGAWIWKRTASSSAAAAAGGTVASSSASATNASIFGWRLITCWTMSTSVVQYVLNMWTLQILDVSSSFSGTTTTTTAATTTRSRSICSVFSLFLLLLSMGGIGLLWSVAFTGASATVTGGASFLLLACLVLHMPPPSPSTSGANSSDKGHYPMPSLSPFKMNSNNIDYVARRKSYWTAIWLQMLVGLFPYTSFMGLVGSGMMSWGWRMYTRMPSPELDDDDDDGFGCHWNKIKRSRSSASTTPLNVGSKPSYQSIPSGTNSISSNNNNFHSNNNASANTSGSNADPNTPRMRRSILIQEDDDDDDSISHFFDYVPPPIKKPSPMMPRRRRRWMRRGMCLMALTMMIKSFVIPVAYMWLLREFVSPLSPVVSSSSSADEEVMSDNGGGSSNGAGVGDNSATGTVGCRMMIRFDTESSSSSNNNGAASSANDGGNTNNNNNNNNKSIKSICHEVCVPWTMQIRAKRRYHYKYLSDKSCKHLGHACFQHKDDLKDLSSVGQAYAMGEC